MFVAETYLSRKFPKRRLRIASADSVRKSCENLNFVFIDLACSSHGIFPFVYILKLNDR